MEVYDGCHVNMLGQVQQILPDQTTDLYRNIQDSSLCTQCPLPSAFDLVDLSKFWPAKQTQQR